MSAGPRMSRSTGFPVRIPFATPIGIRKNGKTKNGVIIQAAFFTPNWMGSVVHPPARSPSMSAKSFVDDAPRRKRPKIEPMYQGSRPRIVFTVDHPATFSSTPRGIAIVMFADPAALRPERRGGVDPAEERREHDDPEALVAALRRGQPGEQPRHRERDEREAPGLAEAERAGRERPLRLVHAVDVEVVDLVDRVVRGVQDRGHQRPPEDGQDEVE